MGRRDIADREYFADCGRFAELINICLYHEREFVLPDDLEVLKRKYPSLSGSAGEKERDILMKDKKRNICYGIEIETELDYSMPVRVMAYDACEYEYQIKAIHSAHKDKGDYKKYCEWKSRMKETDFLFPVITLVLYLGEGKWEGRRKLSQMFYATGDGRKVLELKQQEYEFLLIEVDYENPENYQTDLREFFQAMQCRRDKERLRKLLQMEKFQHLEAETEWAIAVHLHIKGMIQKMKEEIPMCKAFDDLTKELRQEGKKEGKKEEKMLIIRRMLKEGLDESLIIRMTRCTKAEFAKAVGG